MNRDFVEMLDALSVAGADFLVLRVRPTADNAGKVWQALVTFGAPLDDLRG